MRELDQAEYRADEDADAGQGENEESRAPVVLEGVRPELVTDKGECSRWTAVGVATEKPEAENEESDGEKDEGGELDGEPGKGDLDTRVSDGSPYG